MWRAIGAAGMRGVVICALALALTGCMPTKDAPNEAQAGPGTCSKAEFASLVGTPINSAELPLTQTYRVIFPDSVVTTDFIEDRLEVIVDANGIVTELRCG